MEKQIKEAEFLDELINKTVVTTETVSNASERNIDLAITRVPKVLYTLEKSNIPKDVGRKLAVKSADNPYTAQKIQTILGEKNGADNRVEMQKENLIRIFSDALHQYNQYLAEKTTWGNKEEHHVQAIILFGSRMEKLQKPRQNSDIDYIILTNRSRVTIDLPDEFNEYVQKKLSYLDCKLSMFNCKIQTLKEKCSGKMINDSGLFNFLDKQNTVIISENEDLKQFLSDIIPDDYQQQYNQDKHYAHRP